MVARAPLRVISGTAITRPAAEIRWRDLLLLGALTAFGAVSIDLYLPALPRLAASLHTTAKSAQQTMAAFYFGMAVGQLGYGPLADRIGRRRPLLAGCAIYACASLLCAAAPSIELLILGRLLQALGACAGVVVARAVVRDRYHETDTARIFSILTLVLGVAPLLAPSAGALLLTVGGWRAIFVVLAAFGSLLLLAVWRGLPESRSAATARLAASESPLAAYMALIGHRRVLGFVLAGAFNGAALFTYVAGSADLLIGHFVLSQRAFSVVFALNAAGLIGAAQVNRLLLRRYRPVTIVRTAALSVIAAALLFLAAALTGAGFAVTNIGLFGVLTSYGFVSANTLALALALDPRRAGSLSALIGATSFGAGALGATLAAALHDGTPLPMAIVITGSTVLAAAALFGLALRR